jgi:uncharacterized protein YdeI (YjbR/CyaY-like superfamily)
VSDPVRSPDGRAVVDAPDRPAWRAWLAGHHGQAEAIWLLLRKQAGGDEGRLRYAAAVEEALCFGWIDSRANKVDALRYLLLFAPRKRGSGWSALNKERVARLTAARLMEPPGLAAVQAARADGSWDALNEATALVEPDDLRAALDATPRARGHWEAFPPSARRAILEWIGTAKRPETRLKRVTETATLAARGERANQWRPKGV